MDLGIAGKTALLMSSTRGLGFGCAAALVAEGVRVVINGRNKERGIEALAKLGGKAHFVQADVSRPAEREHLFMEARAQLGTISILVTNADGPPSWAFMSKSDEDWQTAFELTMLSAEDSMNRILLRIGGVVNAFFVIFHVWLGYRIHTSPGITAGDRPLMEMLNAGGVLFILLFAVSSLCYAEEMLGTRLGRVVLLFVFLLYGSRAVEEIIIAPQFSPAIFIVCALLAGLYSVLYFRIRNPE